MDLLLIITAVWLAAASFTDFKKREVADWLSFSLIATAIALRAAESIVTWNWMPIATSVIGAAIFFAIANTLYHFKVFAGGDAKLLIGLGAVMPSFALISNILVIGSIYSILCSLILGIINRKKVFSEIKRVNFKGINYIILGIIFVFVISLLLDLILLSWIVGGAAVLFILQVYITIIDRVSLIKEVNPSQLTEGDWLLKDIRLKSGKWIRSRFSGLTKREIRILIKNKKKVYVRYGIPFVPVYLIAFILTALFGNILLLLI